MVGSSGHDHVRGGYGKILFRGQESRLRSQGASEIPEAEVESIDVGMQMMDESGQLLAMQ